MVDDWFDYDGSDVLEEQIKYNIAVNCEMMLNGYYDEPDREPMPKSEWKDYIYSELMDWIHRGGISRSGDNHLRFYGKANTLKLIDEYLENYDCLEPYMI